MTCKTCHGIGTMLRPAPLPPPTSRYYDGAGEASRPDFSIVTIPCPECKGAGPHRDRVKVARASVSVAAEKIATIPPDRSAEFSQTVCRDLAHHLVTLLLAGGACKLSTIEPKEPHEPTTYFAEVQVAMPVAGQYAFVEQMKQERLRGRADALNASLDMLRKVVRHDMPASVVLHLLERELYNAREKAAAHRKEAGGDV